MSSFLSRSLIGSLICYSASSFSEEISLRGTEHYRMAVRHIEGGGVGYSDGYTTLGAFLAPDPSQIPVMPFLDLRGHVFNDGNFAANAGIGVRALAGCRTYGFNAYYDYRNTNHQHYNQVSGGLETLGIRWDFRVNGYLPVGKKISSKYDEVTNLSSSSFDSFSGNYAIVKQTETRTWKKEYSMKGLDAEVAFHFLKNENFDLYAGGKPYYYNYKNKNAVGGQVRLGVQMYQYVSLELINSYDSRFHENFQGQVGINIPIGPKTKVSKSKKFENCSSPTLLAQRIVQNVQKQEIIVVDKFHKGQSTEFFSPAINPLTGDPYFFVFVDNTSNSEGTYESPYPTFALAEQNSRPGDTIYVLPGNGTTSGMDSGILLKANQKLWGASLNYTIQTPDGNITLPAQSSTAPIITNSNVDTEGNAITIATNNGISGITITSPLNDAIYGTDFESLEVSSCIIQNTTTFPIEATSLASSSVSLTNNQFLNNVNGVGLTLQGVSTIVCTDNTFEGQTSVSNVPLEITIQSGSLNILIENNLFNENETGSIRFAVTDATDIDISLLNNTITNNRTGFASSLASNFVILTTGTIDQCTILAEDNTFSGNSSNSFYLHTSGEIEILDLAASRNTMSDNFGSALVVGTPARDLTFRAVDNTISELRDNGISVIASGNTISGNITIKNNTIFDIGNFSNGIAINQNFSSLNLTLLDNEIDSCEGTGIISYAPDGIDSLILNVSGNTVSLCQNMSSNASPGIDFEQFEILKGVVSNNVLFENVGSSDIYISSSFTAVPPTACLEMSGNQSSLGYSLSAGAGTFHLAPCNVEAVNTGVFSLTDVIRVDSCPGADPCF